MDIPFIRIIVIALIIWALIYHARKRRERLDSALKMKKKNYVKKYGTKTDPRENFKLEAEWTEIQREEKALKRKRKKRRK
jgi:FtsZ-interacting cell division protein ZipA|tara:strand:+ start:190 stop:429 length:240 start_codon:yes stop_codon:yes gene_type:complete